MCASTVQIWLVLAAYLSSLVLDTDATKCLKDPLLAEYPVNVYWCNETDKPECCEEDKEFTCCATKLETGLKEQLQLWLSVGAIVCIIFILCLCWKKDTFMCEANTMKEQWDNMCLVCKKKKVDNEKVQLDDLDRDTQNINPVMKSSHMEKHQHNTKVAPSRDDPKYDHVPPDGMDEDSGRGSAFSSSQDSPMHSVSRADTRAQSSVQRSRRNGQMSRASVSGYSEDTF